MAAQLLPLAVAIMLSPFPIIPAILLLFTVRPRLTAAGFLAGWFLGVLVATGLFVLIAGTVEQHDHSPSWVSWVRIGLGTALVLLGIKQWLGRHKRTESPKWMQSLTSSTPRKALTLGALLSAANPKIVLLAAGAGVAIGAADVSTAAQLGYAIAFSAVASLSVAAPVTMFLVAGDRVLAPLGKARDWLERNNATIMAIVITVIGAVLLTKGITR